MTNRYQRRLFNRAWMEYQEIRLLLAEIRVLLGRLARPRQEGAEQPHDSGTGRLRQKLSELSDQLRRRLALEEANGEVAIAMACEPRLDAEVSSLASRRDRLERALSDLLDALEKTENAFTQFGGLENAFSQLSADLTNYLSDKMDVLRRSLLSARESASIGV
jgi:hypothetical protein